jgi:hypothetical protein
MMIELCNKICPFRPLTPECSKCPEIYSLATQPTPGDFSKKSMVTQPEAIAIEPETHAIMFTPEIIVAGVERKQCCYLDKCTTVDMNASCDPICYEPCDSVCTGRCFVNPQCPHECDRVRKQQYKLRYRIWLAGKLNEIKTKYRAMATACLLRTRLAFVGEVQNYYQAAKTALADVQLVPIKEYVANVDEHPNELDGPPVVFHQLLDEEASNAAAPPANNDEQLQQIE